MKAVMISIQPKWCNLLGSGEKSIEIRKTRPKIDTPFKCYIYCTKIKDKKKYSDEFDIPMNTRKWLGNGKVIGEFVCDKIEKFTVGTLRCDDIEKVACLTYAEMIDYFYKPNELDGNTAKFGYAWHISDLKIYDEPKELSEFYSAKVCGDYYNGNSGCEEFCGRAENNECRCGHVQLKRPPQSWCYCEVAISKTETTTRGGMKMNKEKLIANWDDLKDETKAKILELADKEIKEEYFVPKKGERYYEYIASDTFAKNSLSYSSKICSNSQNEKYLFEIGAVFKAEEELVFYGSCDYYTKRFETYVNRHSDKLDWEDDNQVKFNAEWSSFRREIDFIDRRCCKPQGAVCASSEQILQDAINDIGEENFLKYVMKVEK